MQTLAELLPEIVWGVQGLSGSDGSVVLRVPKGLRASLEVDPLLSSMSHRVRLTKDGPLENEFDPELGVLDEERREITVVWYRAPTVLASIKSGESSFPAGARVIFYRKDNGNTLELDVTSLSDGRTRSHRLLPDVEYSARAAAKGYEGPEVRFRLSEGELKELKLELKRAQDSKKDDAP